MCVSDLSIAPSEAWKLDIVEIAQINFNASNEKADMSVMLNFERIHNGASKQWLQNH